MKKCHECEKFYQGTKCSCGFNEKVSSRPIDHRLEWVREQAEALDGCLWSIKRWQDFQGSPHNDSVNDSFTVMIGSLREKIKKIKRESGAYWPEIVKYAKQRYGHESLEEMEVKVIEFKSESPRPLNEVLKDIPVKYI